VKISTGERKLTKTKKLGRKYLEEWTHISSDGWSTVPVRGNALILQDLVTRDVDYLEGFETGSRITKCDRVLIENFAGQQHGRSVESRSATPVDSASQSEEPKGAWRFRLVRSVVSSSSNSGCSTQWSQSAGSRKGRGSARVGCCRLDHGHCVTDSTSCSRTGLRKT